MVRETIRLLKIRTEQNDSKLKSFVSIAMNTQFIGKQNKGVRSVRFIKEVVQTMKDTTWETGKETRKDTTTVVVMSLALIAFFAIVDGIAQGLINFI